MDDVDSPFLVDQALQLVDFLLCDVLELLKAIVKILVFIGQGVGSDLNLPWNRFWFVMVWS